MEEDTDDKNRANVIDGNERKTAMMIKIESMQSMELEER